MVWRSWPIRSYIHMPGRPTLIVSAMTLLAKFSAPYGGWYLVVVAEGSESGGIDWLVSRASSQDFKF